MISITAHAPRKQILMGVLRSGKTLILGRSGGVGRRHIHRRCARIHVNDGEPTVRCILGHVSCICFLTKEIFRMEEKGTLRG
jgi:hypothetical protein